MYSRFQTPVRDFYNKMMEGEDRMELCSLVTTATSKMSNKVVNGSLILNVLAIRVPRTAI